MNKHFLLLFLFSVLSLTLFAQQRYRYRIDLGDLSSDRFSVELKPPATGKSTVTLAFPKIIPGTYSIADYGKFVSEVKAWDKSGKSLPVTRQGDNKWRISNAASLARITYTVEDIFDSQVTHGIYPMAATNIEGSNAVLNMPGVLGYFEGYNKLPFEFTIRKPEGLYASTALEPVSATATEDVFRAANLDELYDSPIMYSAPDTTTVQVGNTEVLVSVYSPNKLVRSQQIAGWLSDLLQATRHYLGGKLPADRYAFLYYFKDESLKHSFPPGLMGALEHSTSSFYYLPDAPADLLRSFVVDVSSHEFFHIITPLTIASREVKEFNFSEPVLSRHLWLYEGVTEYTAHHVQVQYGLNTAPEFLDKLSGKITDSRTNYNDTLAFTVMSRESAGKYKAQYGNVYQKGALIAACLDLYLLHLSDGAYSLANLTHDLGIRYGRDRYFEDVQLFEEIGKLTYPEIKGFLEKYVAGPNAIPYEEYFGYAGISFVPRSERKVVSMGGITPNLNERGAIFITSQSKLNEFGNRLGYKIGDELYAFNGIALTPQNFGAVVDSLKKSLKEGDRFEVRVGRSVNERTDTLTLSAPVMMVPETVLNRLDLMPAPTPKQEQVRAAWLQACPQVLNKPQ